MLAKKDTITIIIFLVAIFFSLVNIVVSYKGKEGTIFMFLSLSSCGLMICSYFLIISKSVNKGLFKEVENVLPYGAKNTVFATIIIIVLNFIPFIIEYFNKDKLK